MRSAEAMLDLILRVAAADERVRAVILNGSRANPDAPRDIFQDFDIVYLVRDVTPFRDGGQWVRRFGELMIMQTPDDMGDPPAPPGPGYAYLLQFTDGNRLDLSFFPVDRLADLERDSLSVLLLDKDGLVAPFAPASDRDYWPKPPTARQFHDCCNEFWWVAPYAAKGLWRGELTYAHYMLDTVMREQLLRMFTWHVGVRTNFERSPGKVGKYLQNLLEPELWALLCATYAEADAAHTWNALQAMGQLFRQSARSVADQFGFDYPAGDDQRVTAHLEHVRRLPQDAQSIY